MTPPKVSEIRAVFGVKIKRSTGVFPAPVPLAEETRMRHSSEYAMFRRLYSASKARFPASTVLYGRQFVREYPNVDIALRLVVRGQERFAEAAHCLAEMLRLAPENRVARKALRGIERCLKESDERG
jgi:hypothetical protein